MGWKLVPGMSAVSHWVWTEEALIPMPQINEFFTIKYTGSKYLKVKSVPGKKAVFLYEKNEKGILSDVEKMVFKKRYVDDKTMDVTKPPKSNKRRIDMTLEEFNYLFTRNPSEITRFTGLDG